MVTGSSWLSDPIPRPLLITGSSVAGFLLVGLFVFLGFPYDRLGELAAFHLEQSTGYQIEIRKIEPRLTIGGPGLKLSDLDIRAGEGRSYRIQRLRVRPAWSLGWLRAQPALHLDIETPDGRALGILEIASEPGWRGVIQAVDLAQLPLPSRVGLGLAGRLDADLDLRLREDGPAGSFSLEARDGSIQHPALPLAVPFTRLAANVDLGSERFAAVVRSFELEGPLIMLQAQGSLGRGAQPREQAVDLDVQLQAPNPTTQALMQGFGVALDAEGRTRVHIGGSLESPQVR
jgi:type II secretion system protein N